jgi:hypothetical protein
VEKGKIYQGGISDRIGAMGAKFLFTYWLGQPIDLNMMNLFLKQMLKGPFAGLLANVAPEIMYQMLSNLEGAGVSLADQTTEKKADVRAN